MEDLKTLEMALNAMIATGEMVEPAERYYADNCSYQEGNQPPRAGGKEGHKKYLVDFFKTVTKVNGITLHSQTVGDGVLDGDVEMEVDDGLEPALQAQGYRLVCVGRPRGDVKLDA